MIQLQKYTPAVYYNQSRDFQFIGRLYDIVLNSVKTNADLVYNVPFNDNVNKALIDLLALTLGFKAVHNYTTKQLIALCSIFPLVLRNKGTINAVNLVCEALLRSEGIKDKFKCTVENNTLIINISQSLLDINLLKDVLEYILPAGMSYQIIRAKLENRTIITKANIDNSINAAGKPNSETAGVLKPDSTGKLDYALENGKTYKNSYINSTVFKLTDTNTVESGGTN